MGEHLLHVYTGDGKGKTTAAMGLALRVLGHGGKALLAQFMKDGTSGELASLASLAGAEVFPGLRMDGFIWRMGEER
ncbi:MAG TPA: cob(I)yrinic acid a,c-diamide adenosyltransferase, partial [Candidatus Limnocylindria bacterium]|nr:cob(I)yrinic acid a,c-diamide adenosyltransferase [Candidatus Limnocylindria bacterium]